MREYCHQLFSLSEAYLDLIRYNAYRSGLSDHVLAHRLQVYRVKVAQPDGADQVWPGLGELDEVLYDGEEVSIRVLPSDKS